MHPPAATGVADPFGKGPDPNKKKKNDPDHDPLEWNSMPSIIIYI